ncbi:Uncharacterised protein [Vibrio cholerae]|nr:Uncharacterised protein [Vibrio cholerae]CSA82189.1 Uncharacterised protein [Vibrio cholerae]CSB24781.1 Uncharacterised protein [Vibrio cholerae]CSB35686.1 Uncharacterised protein [Vibrio cholerae]CSB37367.1 Uncharacterised protein [Vibrio cholerae]
MCGDRNDWRITIPFELLDRFTSGHSIHVRHLNVHQDDIELTALSLLNRLLTAGARDHVLNPLLQ